jgi:hypothetical protein
MLVPLVLALAPVKLAINVPIGTTYKYALTFEIKGPAKMGWVKTLITLTDKAASKEGANTWWDMKYAVNKSEGKGDMAKTGDQMKTLAKLKISFLRSPQNTLVKGRVNGQEVSGETLGNTSDVTFPKTTVLVGSKWSSMIDISAKKSPVTYQFLGEKTWNKRPAYLIQGEITDKSVKTIRPYRFYVDRKTCKTLFADGSAQVTDQGIIMDVSFTLKRIN